MNHIVELIAVVAPFVALAAASVRWGAEQRPSVVDRRPERREERWAIH